jgi:hypothetical protein
LIKIDGYVHLKSYKMVEKQRHKINLKWLLLNKCDSFFTIKPISVSETFTSCVCDANFLHLNHKCFNGD